MNAFVQVQNLSKRFGEIIAVDNLSIEVHQGEIFGFVGPNGAGKSTTLNIITGLLGLDQGKVTIAGLDLAHDAKKIKALIGIVPQEIALFDNLSAKENVAYFAGLYGLKGMQLKDAVIEALAFVGLSDHTKQRAGKMSGGMKRRLNIACGIAHNPKLIVLDEPTVGVDAQSREHIMGSIRTLRSRGATIIYTSHYMQEVQDICDRIAIIDHGKLVANGTEEELLEVVTDAKTITVVTQLVDDNLREQVIKRLSTLPDVRHVTYDKEAGLLRIDVTLSMVDVTPILSVLLELDVHASSINSEAPNLETTFLALTGRELR
jgi:ABC-2 type transport system ATP-binding protein